MGQAGWIASRFAKGWCRAIRASADAGVLQG